MRLAIAGFKFANAIGYLYRGNRGKEQSYEKQ